MADIYQSSLFEPTAPRENLLLRRSMKKKAQHAAAGDAELVSNDKANPPKNKSPSRTSQTVIPFFESLKRRRKSNNNNNNNNSKCSKAHLPKDTAAGREDAASGKALRGSSKFRFFRDRNRHSPPSAPAEGPTDNKSNSKEKKTPSEQHETKAMDEEPYPPVAKQMEVVCHGLLTKQEQLVQKCLLAHPDHDADADAGSGFGKTTTGHEIGPLLVAAGKNSAQLRSNENEVALKYEKFVDTSEMQQQMNQINSFKQCTKDSVKHQSSPPTVSLPGQPENLSAPPVIHEVEENNVEEPPIIEVFLPQRDLPIKPSTDAVSMPPSSDGNATNHLNMKRHKLRHILRRLFNMTDRVGKEDKQRLVEEEEEEEEEEEMEQKVQAVGGRHDDKSSKRKEDSKLSTANEHDGDSAKKSRLTAKNLSRLGCSARRSLRRGCHYIGLSIINITTYIPEATYMEPPALRRCKNYDGEYIYATREYYIVNDYL